MSYRPPDDPPAYTAAPTAPLYPNVTQPSYQQPYYYPPQHPGGTTKPPAYGAQGGYQPLPGENYPQQYQAPVIVAPPVASQSIIFVGGCPACRVGVLEDDYSCLAICCAVVFFPIGLLCCLALKEKRCTNCGAVFG